MGHAGTDAQALLHLGAAQVQIAVPQANLFAQFLVVRVELERGRLGAVEDLELLAQHLDLSRGQIGVFGARGAAAHLALHLEHELAAHRLGHLEGLDQVRVEYHLHQPFTVTQVNENDAAMIAAAVGPAAELDLGVHVEFGHLTAVVGAHAGLTHKKEKNSRRAGMLRGRPGRCNRGR